MTIEQSEDKKAQRIAAHGLQTIYADLIPEISLGYPVSKLVLATQGSDGRTQANVAICVPTLQLLEAARNLLRLAKESESQLDEFRQLNFNQMHELLKDVAIDGPSPTFFQAKTPT